MSKLSEKIRAVNDVSAQPYHIPEWDVTLEIRSMTARSRAAFVAQMSSEDGTIAGVNDPGRIEGMWWHVISQTCFDPASGELAFDAEDADWFMEKNAKIVNSLANECMAASGLSDEAADEAGKDSSASLTDEADEILNDDSTSD